LRNAKRLVPCPSHPLAKLPPKKRVMRVARPLQKLIAIFAMHTKRPLLTLPPSGRVNTYRRSAVQFEELRDALVPDSIHAFAQRSVAQTREPYERSKDTLRSVYESWEKSFGAVGKGAVAFNRKVIDIAERNINTGFEFAANLAGAKNLAEAMELQASYWREQFNELRAQAEEVQALTRKVSADVAEPIRSQFGEAHLE
jgi:phasin